MKTITLLEWRAIPWAFKKVDQYGDRWALVSHPTYGYAMQPVKILDPARRGSEEQPR